MANNTTDAKTTEADPSRKSTFKKTYPLKPKNKPPSNTNDKKASRVAKSNTSSTVISTIKPRRIKIRPESQSTESHSSLPPSTSTSETATSPTTSNNKNLLKDNLKSLIGTSGAVRKAKGSRKRNKNRKSISSGKRSRSRSKRKRKRRRKRKLGDMLPSPTPSAAEEPKDPYPSLYIGITNASAAYVCLSVEGFDEEPGNRPLAMYDILDQDKRLICTAVEQSSRKGGSRPFIIRFLDADQQVAYTVERNGTCALCFWGVQCYGNVVTVTSKSPGLPDAKLLARIRQCNVGKPNYEVRDGHDVPIMYLEGPNLRTWYRNFLGSDASFKMYEIGRSENQSSQTKELLGEFRIYSSPKSFTRDPFVLIMEFPKDLHPDSKVIMLAAGTLMDLSFYENHPGICVLYGNFFYIVVVILLIFLLLFIFLIAWILF